MICVSSVTVTPSSVTIKKGKKYTPAFTVCPTNATNKTLRWNSSNANIARVDSSTGQITGVSVGTTYIYARATDGSYKYDYIKVTVTDVKVTSVTLDKTILNLKKDDSYQLEATVKPDDATDKSLTWISSNSSIVKVENGLVTALQEGNATVTVLANDGSGKRAVCSVTVYVVDIENITLDRSNVELKKGENITLSSTIEPADASNKELDWTSSDENIATVDQNGKITAVSEGRVTITATAKDGSGKSVTCDVFVADTMVDDVSIKPLEETIREGDSIYLEAIIYPATATNQDVIWSSSDESIATINPETGLLIAEKAGRVIITATSVDGSEKNGTYEIVIGESIKVENIYINPPDDKEKWNVGDTYQMFATVGPEDAKDKSIKWSSSDTSVLVIDENTGEITCKSGGTATIYATAADGGGAQSSYEIFVIQSTKCPYLEILEKFNPDGVVADPIDAYRGAHIIAKPIMTLYGGQNLKLVAHYNSTKLRLGSFGDGWYHDYEKKLEYISEKNEYHVYNCPTVYSKYVHMEGTNATYTCTSVDKNGYILTVDDTQEYQYSINCNFDHTEYYDSQCRLAKITNHQGFDTIIEYQGNEIVIIDTMSNKRIHLVKDWTDKIVRIYDDAGREATMSYDGNRLIQIYDLNGNVTNYTYDEDGRILTGVDANNVCYFENEYDELGRIISQKDALSNITTFAYVGLSRLTVDRNGNESTRTYNEEGLLLSYTDEEGNTKSYEYDERGNITKEIFANGSFISRIYNNFNKPEEIIDRNGNVTTAEYDSFGNIVKVCYPAVNGIIPKDEFTYNSRNQLIKRVDVRGTITSCSYDENNFPSSMKFGEKKAIRYSFVNGLLVSQIDAMDNTTIFSYNTTGQLVSKTSADDTTTTFEYDNMGNLIKVTDDMGNSISYVYNSNYQISSAVDANGNSINYVYNDNLKNTSIYLPDNNMISFEFDNEDRPVKRINQKNEIITISYDKSGKVIAKNYPDGGQMKYEYDSVGNVIKETNQNGAVTIREYDAKGNVVSLTDNDSNKSYFEYNSASKLVKFINAFNGIFEYEYSIAGDLLKEIDPLGNEKTYTYDAFGNRITSTDANGNTTTYSYDDNNNIVSIKDALNNTTSYTYDSQNRVVDITDAKNNVIHLDYDALGRCTCVTDAKNNVFTLNYDANGNIIKISDAKGNCISEIEYNSLNKISKVTDSIGKSTTCVYNELGLVEKISDPMNNETTYLYNARGQKTVAVDALGNESSATYDLLGNLTRVADPLGGQTIYSYDEMGKLISMSTTHEGIISYTYNELNVEEQITNARGQVRTLEYDIMGRIIKSTGIEGEISYTYDKNGNVLTVTDISGTITREYDALNRVTKYIDTYGKQICYQYDSVGNLVKLTYPDGTEVNYTYDANHNLVSVVDWANRTTTYTYDENNKLTGVIKPDGSVTTTVYDSKQRITSTTEITSQGVVISGFEYVYDDVDRLIQEKLLDNNTKICYTYDDLSRVIKKTVLNADDVIISEENFTYDAAGNITSNLSNMAFSYGTNNKLASYAGQNVEYDLDGNMLSVQIDGAFLTLQYDSFNRLISVDNRTYTYNADNTRIRNFCEEEDTTYTYNTNCRLSQLLQRTKNGFTTKYVYGKGLIGEESSSAFKTYHFDFRGSTIAITDITGSITDTFKYDTYGKVVERSGNSDVVFAYNGRDGVITDKNGLIYMRARYYTPELRRFVNADIIIGTISDPRTLNRYAYVNGNPVSYVDPFGLSREMTTSPDSFVLDVVKYALEEVIKVTNEHSKEDLLVGEIYAYPVTFSCTVKETLGEGVLDIAEIAKGHIEIASSINWDNITFETSLDNEMNWVFKYNVRHNEYTNVAASVKYVPIKNSVAIEYTVEELFTNNYTTYSVSTTITATVSLDGYNNNVKEPSLSFETVFQAIGEFIRNLGEIFGSVLDSIFTFVEEFVYAFNEALPQILLLLAIFIICLCFCAVICLA